MAKKEHLNLIFIGHVDHGKSTTVGRILYETGAISEQKLNKLKEEAAKLGKQTFEFAFVMDSLKEERERGVTIDLAHREFETNKYHFTIIDAPGHRDFVKNMITGASQADAAILVVSAKDGPQPQTKEHAFLAHVLGISQMAVSINKMDAVNFDEAKYKEVVDQLKEMFKKIGFKQDKIDKIQFIPTSGFTGDNIAKKSEKMSWYKGPTLLEEFDKFIVPAKPYDKPLRLPIQEVYSITGHGTVPVGEIKSGKMKPGDLIVFMPSGIKTDVKKIEMHHQELPEATVGDNIGFNVKGVDKKAIRRGEVVGHPNSPPRVAEEFTAQIVVLDHPTAITVGYTPVFHMHTTQFAGKIVEIQKQIAPEPKDNPQFIKAGSVAIVKIKPTKPVVAETFKDFPALGRFVIRDMGQSVAAGVILEVVDKK